MSAVFSWSLANLSGVYRRAASGLFCQFLSAQEVGVNRPGKDGGAFLLTGQLASLFALDFYSTSFLFG